MSDVQPLLLRFDEFELDEANARLAQRAGVLVVPPRAFSVLCELARRPGQLVTKEVLLDAVWGHRHVTDSVLKSAISQLRAARDDDAKQPRYIETVSRRGYRFVAEARPTNLSTARSLRAPTSVTRELTLPELTGRGPALARLQRAWEVALSGRRQLLWLSGEAGVGKSTIVDHFAAGVGSGTAVARGQCVDQHGPGEPYLPVLEALGTLARGDPILTAMLRNVAPTWLLQMPWLCSEGERESLGRELAGTTQDRMLREFGELLDRYALERPLLLITEDLHWSDHATVSLINHVARRRAVARWMWLATFRVAEIFAEDHPVKALRHELRMHRLAEEIPIEPFSEKELADYVARRLDGAPCPEAFLRALHRHTDGLPLFVANVVDDLLAEGTLLAGAPVAADHRTLDVLAVPESLAGVLGSQIERLPTDQITLLEVASICGVDFRPNVVARVLERELDWVDRQCDGLARRRQWLSALPLERNALGELEGRYAFRHALFRHVFRERIGAHARAQLHRRVARVLASTPGVVTAAEIAMQFELGQDPDAALPYCTSAAERAHQHFAPTDTMRLAERGLALATSCVPSSSVLDLSATLHTLHGAAASQLLGVSARETLRSFDAAQALMESLPTHPLRSMALHGLGLGLFLRDGPGEARRLAERHLVQAQERRDPVLTVAACDLLGQIIKLEGPHDQAIAVLDTGIRAATSLDERTLQTAFVLDPLVNMRAAIAIPLLLAGSDARSKSQSEQALARARAVKQPMARMIATWLALLCELRRGARDMVAVLADELRGVTDEGAVAHGAGPSRWFLGLVQAWSGSPAEGHRLIDQAYRQYAQVGMMYGSAEVLGYAAEALILAGDLERASAQVAEALQLAERSNDHSYLTQLLLLKRRIALEQSAVDAARLAGDEALIEARRQSSPWLELTVLVDLCQGEHGRDSDIEALRGVLAGLSQSSSAPLVRRAHALLECR